MGRNIQCPVCEQSALAEVATGDAAIQVAENGSVCKLKPREHDGMGFRYYVHGRNNQ